MKKNKKNILISLFVAFLIFSGGYILGYQRSLPVGGGIFPQIINQDGGKQVDFRLFWKTWDILEDKYSGDLDPQKMLYGAIAGMTGSLGDPYTVFLTPEEKETFEEDLTGTFSGIGAEIGIKKNQLQVIAPLAGSPAQRAGLKPGTPILKINDENTLGMGIMEAVHKIRGKEGTEVKLTIVKNGKEKVITIKREKITVKSVESSMKGDILYINISRFDEETLGLVRQAEADGISKGAKGIILDLRNNPGGYLDSAVDISSEFIDTGIIVIEKDEKRNKKRTFKASGLGKMTDKAKYPMIVLVNEGSASASEIVAGAIRDNGRGKILGEKTFGKGSVQELKDLPDGSELKVTVAQWYTPNGVNISKEGLKPDVAVKLTDKDFDNNKDPQLSKTLELLSK